MLTPNAGQSHRLLKRGRPATFTKYDILRAVQKIGFTNLSLGSVSRELGVTTPAMYRLFPSCSHMIDFCIQHVFSTNLMPVQSEYPADIIRETCENFWAIFEQFPGLSTMVQKHPLSPQFYVAVLGNFISALEAKGLSRENTLTLVRHLPVILSTHHAVSETQRRDAMDNKVHSGDLEEVWLALVKEETEFVVPKVDPQLLTDVSKCLILNWNSAWACIEDILQLVGITESQRF